MVEVTLPNKYPHCANCAVAKAVASGVVGETQIDEFKLVTAKVKINCSLRYSGKVPTVFMQAVVAKTYNDGQTDTNVHHTTIEEAVDCPANPIRTSSYNVKTS